jgi:aryl-alcohol dehydrogenase-like predicted oxidoreductase
MVVKRMLGNSDMEISPLGFGAWAAGGGGYFFGWGSQDDDDSIAAMRRAVELGVNWIDTAPAYGRGHSEEVVGALLHGLPEAERPHVFTKCGLVWDDANPGGPVERRLDPPSIRRECEASLRRLDVERIDLFQFHQPDDSTGTEVEDSWAEMLRLVDEGKVRAGGVSNFGVDLLERCKPDLVSVQSPLSLIRREIAGDVLPWAVEHGVGVLVYSPMQSGLLTDSFSPARVAGLPADDWRSRDAEFQPPLVERNVALRDALGPVAERHGTTVAAVAVAWTLAGRGVSGAIVGARTADQVSAWARAADLALTDADLDEIAAAVSTTGAGSGPDRP